ncbi:MAG TPA: IgGFc-binding protein [Polyangiaceae bacterium]|nr:IgGFc-binding protein [Polyangiaceae bacterium]
MRRIEARRARRSGTNPSRALALLLAGGFALGACTPDPSDRWLFHPAGGSCTPGTYRCDPELEQCTEDSGGPAWVKLEDCSKQGLVCAVGLGACSVCVPNSNDCQGSTAVQCSADGTTWEPQDTCDESAGEACRDGVCDNLCSDASRGRSNVGCEYWAVDLDNADVDATLNAAAQQYAVVVSNAQPDVTAHVTIEQDDTQPGDDNAPYTVAEADIPPLSLRVFPLGPREVDGSPPGEFNSGTNSALTRQAFRVRSSFPVVAYQFNPLTNVGVFSNDASLLKPREAVEPDGDGMQTAYVVVGWPQTIAHTQDPRTSFGSTTRVDLRAFLTLVGTRAGTNVRVATTTRFLGAPGIPATDAGGEISETLGAFDVLNLETDDFNADFTGSIVEADGPIIAYTGSEASDAPYFTNLGERYCCADHLEEQLDPVRTAGVRFIAAVTPNRTDALAAAGAAIGHTDQDDYFRVVATTTSGAHITTSLDSAPAVELVGQGDYYDIPSHESFSLTSDSPITLMSVSPSQEAAGVPQALPGGDPSSLIIPPIEQFRSTYVFLTPDEYAFDFVRISAPATANIVFDGRKLDDLACASAPAGMISAPLAAPEAYVVYSCQLGFPIIDPNGQPPENFQPGTQNDGVHVIESDRDIGVLVDGFDRYVSYAYAAGTELSLIVPR